MRSPLATIPFAALLLLGSAAGVSAQAAPPAAAPRVHVTVTAVKALAAAEGVATVAPGLDKLAAKLKRLPFGRYEDAGTTNRTVGLGETVSVPFGEGRWTVVARAASADVVKLEIREFGPGAGEACLSTTANVEPGMANITFCDGVPGDGTTFIFIATAELANP